MNVNYKFFHWHCETCGAFGGAQLPADLSELKIREALQTGHDETFDDSESCKSEVEIDPN